ncbi:MAG TPA: cell division protein FtsL [Longimicrobiales bacterium]|nr:cell division protein FtsL [Longimicrobiales bacterium]
MRSFSRTLLLALGFAVLLASLSAVIWRQSRALDAQRAAELLRDESALLEARRAQLAHRLQELESRNRVIAVAQTRLGMHVPTSTEIVLLPAARAAAEVAQ